MPSSASTRLLLELQAAGENLNAWGGKLNTLFSMVDKAIRGRAAITVNTTATLSGTNFTSTDDTAGWWALSGTGGTLTIPSRERIAVVKNGCTADVTVTTGSGTSAVVGENELTVIVCDATNVYQLGVDGDSIKAYVDAQAFAALEGDLPGQSGQAGKYLQTDGSTAGWADITVADIADLAGRTVTGAGLASNNGDGELADGNVVITVTAATGSDVQTGTSAATAVTPDALFDAAASVSLTDGATITPDFAAGFNFHVTLGGNRTLANPSNPKAGQSGRIRVVQDGTGSRTLSYGTAWKFPGGAPTLSTAASAVDVITYFVHDSSTLECRISRAFS